MSALSIAPSMAQGISEPRLSPLMESKMTHSDPDENDLAVAKDAAVYGIIGLTCNKERPIVLWVGASVVSLQNFLDEFGVMVRIIASDEVTAPTVDSTHHLSLDAWQRISESTEIHHAPHIVIFSTKGGMLEIMRECEKYNI